MGLPHLAAMYCQWSPDVRPPIGRRGAEAELDQRELRCVVETDRRAYAALIGAQHCGNVLQLVTITTQKARGFAFATSKSLACNIDLVENYPCHRVTYSHLKSPFMAMCGVGCLRPDSACDATRTSSLRRGSMQRQLHAPRNPNIRRALSRVKSLVCARLDAQHRLSRSAAGGAPATSFSSMRKTDAPKVFETWPVRGSKPVFTAPRTGSTGARGLLAPRVLFFPAGLWSHGLRAVAGGGHGRKAPAPFPGGRPHNAGNIVAGGGDARNSPAPFPISVPSSSRRRDHAAGQGPHMSRRVQIPSVRGKARPSLLDLRAGFASPAFSQSSTSGGFQ